MNFERTLTRQLQGVVKRSDTMFKDKPVKRVKRRKVINPKCSTVYSTSESEWSSSNSSCNLEGSKKKVGSSKKQIYNPSKKLSNNQNKDIISLNRTNLIISPKITRRPKFSILNKTTNNVYNEDTNKLKVELKKMVRQKVNKFLPNTTNKVTKSKLSIAMHVLNKLNNDSYCTIRMDKLSMYQVEFAEIIEALKTLIRRSKAVTIKSVALSPQPFKAQDTLFAATAKYNPSFQVNQSLKASIGGKMVNQTPTQRHTNKNFNFPQNRYAFQSRNRGLASITSVRGHNVSLMKSSVRSSKFDTYEQSKSIASWLEGEINKAKKCAKSPNIRSIGFTHLSPVNTGAGFFSHRNIKMSIDNSNILPNNICSTMNSVHLKKLFKKSYKKNSKKGNLVRSSNGNQLCL